jgi:catechol-2,3-dioxygenase
MPPTVASNDPSLETRQPAPSVHGLAELTLETRDIQRMERFYREGIGLELLSRDSDRVWLALGRESRLGLWSPGIKEFGDRGGSHVHFAMSVSAGRLLEVARGVEAAGVTV